LDVRTPVKPSSTKCWAACALCALRYTLPLSKEEAGRDVQNHSGLPV
jgi:hypothetical protein